MLGVIEIEVTPRKEREAEPVSSNCESMPFTLEIGIAKPRPCPLPEVAVLIPMTWPAAFTSGPPEFPALIAASVWTRSFRVS